MSARPAFRELERVEHRVLGALRCVDASTGAAIDTPLEVVSLDTPPARLGRNRSGLIVIREWPPLAAHAPAFEQPPALPAIGSLALRLAIRDPAGRYLPRRVTVALPRDAGGDHALFEPRRVALYPSPQGAVGANWSRLRVTVVEATSGDALGGVLLRVLAGDRVLARGLTDARGEALVAVVGVPVTTFSSTPDAVVVSQIAVTLDASFDPRPGRDSSGQRTPAAVLLLGRPADAEPLVDPDLLEAERLADPDGAPLLGRAALALSIAARESNHRRLTIALPP